MKGDLPERKLVKAFVRSGDEEAFRSLYRMHAPVMYRIALRMLAGSDEAQDVVQNSWLRAARSLSVFRWESSLGTWLVGITINCARESRRRHADRIEPPDLCAAGPPNQALRIDLERAIASLPDRYREVLVLHEIEGYKHREIAELLGIDEGTSKSHLHRARRALRVLFETSGERR